MCVGERGGTHPHRSRCCIAASQHTALASCAMGTAILGALARARMTHASQHGSPALIYLVTLARAAVAARERVHASTTTHAAHAALHQGADASVQAQSVPTHTMTRTQLSRRPSCPPRPPSRSTGSWRSRAPPSTGAAPPTPPRGPRVGDGLRWYSRHSRGERLRPSDVAARRPTQSG